MYGLDDITDDKWTFVVLILSEKRIPSPRQGSTPQASNNQWDALTIELPRLRWKAKVLIRYNTCCPCSSHQMFMLMHIYGMNVAHNMYMGPGELGVFIDNVRTSVNLISSENPFLSLGNRATQFVLVRSQLTGFVAKLNVFSQYKFSNKQRPPDNRISSAIRTHIL